MIAPCWSIRNTNGQMLRVPLCTSTSPWRSADTGGHCSALRIRWPVDPPGSDCNIPGGLYFGRCLIEAHLDTYTQDGPGHLLFTDDTRSVSWSLFHPPSKWYDGSGLASRAAAISCLVTTGGHGVRERLKFNPHNSGVQVKHIALTFTFCWNSLLSIQPKSQSGFLVIKVHS